MGDASSTTTAAWGGAHIALRRFLKRWGFDIVFGVVLGLHVVMIWGVDFPPLQDYGGHVQFMDIVARHGDADTAYAQHYALPDRPLPNTLSLGVAWLLSGVADANTVGRLLLTLYVVGFPLALLALCVSAGRPRWWVFFATPLTINPMLTIGLLNYVLALPLIVWGIALAIDWARDGRRLAGWLLMGVLVLLGFAHMIGYLFGGLFIGGVLLLYSARWRDVWRFAVFVPSIAPAVGFLTRLGEVTPVGPASAVHWGTLEGAIRNFWYAAIDTFSYSVDDVIGVAMYGLVAVLLVQHHALSERTPLSLTRVLQRLRGDVLIALLVLGVALYFALPFSYGEVWITLRLTVLVLALLLLAVPYRATALTGAAIGVAVLLSVAAPLAASAQFAKEAERLDGLAEGLATLPAKSRLLAPTPGPEPGRALVAEPAFAQPRGLHAVLNGGVVYPSFTTDWFAPVHSRPGKAPSGNDATRLGALDYDYVLLRSLNKPARALDAGHLELTWHANHWWLFKVTDPYAPRYAVVTPSRLGELQQRDCGRQAALAGLIVHFDAEGVAGVVPRCVNLSGSLRVVGKPRRLAVSGAADPDQSEAVSVDCPRGQIVTGLVGTEAVSIRSLGVECKPPHAALRSSGGAHSATIKMGRPSDAVPAPVFRLGCPDGTVAVSYRGRAGLRLEAVGLACDAVYGDEP